MNSIKNHSPLCSVKLELMEAKYDALKTGSGCNRRRPN